MSSSQVFDSLPITSISCLKVALRNGIQQEILPVCMDSNQLFLKSILLVIFFEYRPEVVEVTSAPFLVKDDRSIKTVDQAFVVIFPDEFVETVLF